jgi:hypothetical protein
MTKENRIKRYKFYIETGQKEKVKELEEQFSEEFPLKEETKKNSKK